MEGKIEDRVDRLLIAKGFSKRKKSQWRTKKVLGVPVWFIAVAISSSIVLGALLGLLGGEQVSTITVTGLTAKVLFDGDPLHDSLVIPEDITAMNNGEYFEFAHSLESLDEIRTFEIDFAIDDSWFSTPEAEEYGLEYGVKDDGGNPIESIMLDPLATENIKFWWETDEDMLSGEVTTTITLSGGPIGFTGQFGFQATQNVASNNPMYEDYSVAVDSVVVYEWDSDPTSDFDDTSDWTIQENGHWTLKYAPGTPPATDAIMIKDTVLDTDIYHTDLVVDCDLYWDNDGGDFDGVYGFYLCYADADNYFYAEIDDDAETATIDWVIGGTTYKTVTEDITSPTGGASYPCVITMGIDDIVMTLDGTTLATLEL